MSGAQWMQTKRSPSPQNSGLAENIAVPVRHVPPKSQGSSPCQFAGYAALFDIADAAKDTIHPGAFSQTLAQQSGPIPLLWQHRLDKRIGWITHAQEDQKGLRVIATLDNPSSRAAHLLSLGEICGLSFGYRARKARHEPQGRQLLTIDLFEVSLVTHPLQHGARVHMVC